MLKVVFPLLSSSIIHLKENELKQNNHNDDNTNAVVLLKTLPPPLPPCVKIIKDVTFHGRIPYLSHPQVDLVELNKFCNRGCVSNLRSQ